MWWIDAGWYPCRDARGERHWWNTGTWEPDPERFPSGLAPVAAHAADRGAELLLWFEPERVVRGSRLDLEHPEWLLRVAATGREGDGWEQNRLLDLGNDECREWLTRHVSSLVGREGVRVYRQDFNFEPLRHWRENEADDRRGMRENLHVQGYLRFWDDLLARHPGLWIDSCASGGRRNDLETMRRSVPLHYSDYGYGLHAAKLGFQQTLSAWIPYFKDAALSWDTVGPDGDRWFQRDTDPFAFHCALAPMLALAVDIRRDDLDLGMTRRMVELWRRAADLVLRGDAYALTPWSADPRRWVVRQFDRPEEGRGLVQGIRLPGCAAGELAVGLRALRPERLYVFENGETGEGRRMSGAAAAAGFVFRLPERAAELWFYRAAD